MVTGRQVHYAASRGIPFARIGPAHLIRNTMSKIPDNESVSLSETVLGGQSRTVAVRKVGLTRRLAGFDLYVEIDASSGLIQSASVQGAGQKGDRAILDDLCRSIGGYALDEALPNGANTALYCQIGKAAAPLVDGIALLRNAPPLFVEIDTALKSMRTEFSERYGHVPPMSSVAMQRWMEQSAQERLDRLAGILRQYLVARQCPAESVVLAGIENDIRGRPVRAVCIFGAACVAGEESLPRFIRYLERHFRQALDVPIEVLADEQQDRNKLRQLIVIAKSGEQRSE